MTQRRCQSCTTFYDKRLPECPECAAPRYAVNPSLLSERWRRSLNQHAEHARKYS